MKSFKEYLKEEGDGGTTTGDIATVDTKLDLSKKEKSKICKKHQIQDCPICFKRKLDGTGPKGSGPKKDNQSIPILKRDGSGRN